MAKLFELLRLPKPITQDIGIEIEYEGEAIFHPRYKYWRVENDGSLRGRFPEESGEIVLTIPVPFNKVSDALKEIAEAHKDSKFKFSHRTSVHVHLNVQDMEGPHLLNLIYTYLLLEEPLMAFCGEGRQGNRFCLRLKDAEGIVDTLVNVFGDYRQIVKIAGDSVRYASINLEAIKKYGSLEFRGMRGTMDTNLIMDWVRMIYVLKSYAITKATPKDIHAEVMEIGVQAWAKKVLKSLYKLFNEEDVYKGVASSFSLSYDLPFAYKDVVIEAPKAIKPPKIQVIQEGYINGAAPVGTQYLQPDEQMDPDQRAEYYELVDGDEHEAAQHYLDDWRWEQRNRPVEAIHGIRVNPIIIDDLFPEPPQVALP